jgi:hypothetical protein
MLDIFTSSQSGAITANRRVALQCPVHKDGKLYGFDGLGYVAQL